MIIISFLSYSYFPADGYNYSILNNANRESGYVTPLERSFVTPCYLWDGIVLRELQGQKCQQRVRQHSDVVQTGQVGWMVLILQWKMVRSKERSALVIVLQVANTA